ncbi:hypothetical protein DXG01_000727 [Tephrocybe rancida]|nr:hypothetical protein DXG01_000727 [Tephrocybe rancida]
MDNQRFRLFQEFEEWRSTQATQQGQGTTGGESSSPQATLPSQAVNSSAMVATPQAPVQTIYPSSLTLPTLPSTANMSVSAQPYVGFSSLSTPIAGSLSASHANTARLASASAILPRPPHAGLPSALARRGNNRAGAPSSRGRGRGPATSAPRLVTISRRRDANDCLLPEDNEVIRLLVFVYPPIEPGQERYLFHIDGDTFRRALQDIGLVFQLELRLDEHVKNLLARITHSMRLDQAFSYRFADPPAGAPVTSPLLLLSVRNRGNPQRGSGQITLAPWRVEPGMTLLDIAQDNVNFAVPRCIDSTNRLIVSLAVRNVGLRHMVGRLIHSCMPARFYQRFPRDTQYGEDPGCQSGGEEELSEEETDVGSVIGTPEPDSDAEYVIPAPPPSQARPSLVRSVRSIPQPLVPCPAQPIQAEVSLATLIVNSLPSTIWDPDLVWPAPLPSYIARFSLETLTTGVYHQATRGTPANAERPSLHVHGSTISQMANAYLAIIDTALEVKDFQRVLFSDRHFLRDDNSGAHGVGVEDEVLQCLLERYISEANRGRYLVPAEEELCTLQCMTSFTHVPSAHLQDMARFGAVVALSLINGRLPPLVSPALILFLIHDFDLRCLTKEFVGECFPSLRWDLLNWIELGPQGDPRTPELIARFGTYVGTHPSIYIKRDDALHKMLAVELLYKSLLGRDCYRSPEFKAFREGFKLPCVNGFSFCDILRTFEGGPEHFLTLAATCQITCPDDLLPHLQVYTNSSLNALSQQIRDAVDDQSITFHKLFADFIKGQGAPCPTLFEEFKPNFDPIVDLATINTPAFRSRILVWAVTGKPLLDPVNPGPIQIWPTTDTDSQYATTSSRAAMVQQGTMAFCTCFKLARFPASFILHLAQGDYEADQEPGNFRDTFDNWVLIQMILSIGNHTQA